jgi:poly-gamma-glutamate synthesis protein (capsule biosynthesis protein)
MNLRNASLVCGVLAATFVVGCDAPSPEPEITLVLTGQTLVKKDPRLRWDDPFGTLRSIVEGADVAFTNFEMAVVSGQDRCGLPIDYEVSLGTPPLPPESRPGNTGGPHAVQPAVMDFLADLGFDLMSLSNNHAWDLGDCGVAATREAADAHGIVHAGTGRGVEAATAPGFITVGDMTIGLIATTTSHDERSAIHDAVNGVWTGWQEDWDRNVKAVQDAAARADFVIFYQHFQIDPDEFSELSPGDSTGDGHIWIDDVEAWQTAFARAVLDAGASLYVGHGHRAFDGIEVYKGKPLLRQLGGLAYQGLNPVIGAYDEHRPWEGLIAELTIRGSTTERIEFTPLDLDEGGAYRSDHGDVEFLSRRGLPKIATGPLADSILRRFRDLSARYGAAITVAEGHAALSFAPDG